MRIFLLVLGLAAGGIFFALRYKKLRDIVHTMFLTETTDLSVVHTTMEHMVRTVGSGSGYYEVKGKLWAKVPVEGAISGMHCALYTLLEEKEVFSSGVNLHVSRSRGRDKKSKGSVSFGGLLVLMFIIMKVFNKAKAELDRTVISGQDLVISDGSTILYVDTNNFAHLVCKEKRKDSFDGYNVTEESIRQGSDVYILGHVYTDNGKVRIGPSPDSKPYVLSTMSEQEYRNTLKTRVWVLAGISTAIAAIIATSDLLLQLILYI